MPRFGWPPDSEHPNDAPNPLRPVFKPANEEQESKLATFDWIIQRCELELERLRAEKVAAK